ncbi:unnamed protein product [Ambrosiozyma monospora]|uniref:Unnamed protein product n=1 Tax=Ambrosiozyma monospora TaxID=43982 RepID=A0ACB5T700_AMBMO|nr:unnamed protein product [Ambrosiozyma monospora]
MREIISVSRKTARGLKQTLEDIAEQLIANHRQRQLQLQPVPVRIPHGGVNGGGSSHPLLNPGGARNYSTMISKRLFSTRVNPQYFKNQINPNSFFNFKKINVSTMSRNVLYQTQPFRFAGGATKRAGVQFGRSMGRGGYPSGLFSHFPQHNARMFSTYGPNVASQAVHNLTQSLRAGFIKGGSLAQHLGKSHVGSMNTNPNVVAQDIKLARTDSEASNLYSEGCFVEFTIPSSYDVAAFTDSSVCQDDEESEFSVFQEETETEISSVYRKQGHHQNKRGSRQYQLQNGLTDYSTRRSKVTHKERFLMDDEIFADFRQRHLKQIRALMDQAILRETIWKEIEALRDGIGAAVTERFHRHGDIVYRFYYADCETIKMESHLDDLSITHGTVVPWCDSSLASSGTPMSRESSSSVESTTTGLPLGLSLSESWSPMQSNDSFAEILSPSESLSSASENETDDGDFSFYYANEPVLSNASTVPRVHIESVSSVNSENVVIATH